MITLGTGLGGGIILGGKLHTGLTGAGGEPGHMVIFPDGRECGCGRRGCWERYAAATGLKTTALEYMDNYPESLMWELCVGLTERLDGRTVFEAFRAGDPAAVRTVGKYTEHLAIGIVNIINILEPEIFCVGGGVSNAWDCLEKPLATAVEAEKFMRFLKDTPKTKLVKAKLGNDAGIIGAAMLGREWTNKN
jgi:glucokinase